MLYRFFTIILLALAGLPVDAATLKGVIIEDELAGSPMPNVVVADEAQTTNPSVADDLGRFTLEFRQKRAGDSVRIIVRKEGYLVVNEDQLDVIIPADPDAKPLTIIICLKAEREKWVGLLYRVAGEKVTEET